MANDPAGFRHLLRRLAFTSTPALERAFAGWRAEAVATRLAADARRAPQPPPPECVRVPWVNTALRFADTTPAQYDSLRAAQIRSQLVDQELVRQWWIRQLTNSQTPLREHLTLFFQNTFGSSTSAIEIPHALYGLNARLRRLCLGTIPALLDEIILDPAMMMQIGMDEHGKARVSDRPAKLVLDYWTVGAGEYTDRDVEELSRALTGWSLKAPAAASQPRPLDPSADRPARRTGLTPTFDPGEFDSRPKTILGSTANFDARSAMRFLARQPTTARRFSGLLARYLGVEDPRGRLVERLTAAYRETDGAIDALLRELARSDEFRSDETRWSLIKSPAHLMAAACRQLELTSPPVEEISRWMTASGQTLFDTPNSGEGGWPGQEAWVTPGDRLLVRYQLGRILTGEALDLGIRRAQAPAGHAAAPPRSPLLDGVPAGALLTRLDPAPGITASSLPRNRLIQHVMATPQYQLA